MKEQALSYNEEVLQSVSSFFADQNANLKKTMNYIYYGETMENGRGNAIISSFQYLNSHSPKSSNLSISNETRKNAESVYSFLDERALPSDPNLLDTLLVNATFDFKLMGTRNGLMKTEQYFPKLSAAITENSKDSNINRNKTYLIPAFAETRDDSSPRVYSIYDYLRDPEDPSVSIGYLIMTYRSDMLKKAYERYQKYLVGTILILSQDGGIIFDSSGQYYDKPFPYSSAILESSGSTMTIRNSIININENEEYGFLVVGMIPQSELFSDVRSITRVISYTALVCLLLTLALTFLGTSVFSKRLGDVLRTIKEIQKGNLSARALTQDRKDEVGLIAYNLNLMSERLEEYIKREYIWELQRKDAELKQKTAELYALQSQINPHFLYNTLEAIRMKALSMQDYTVSQMIKMLANLFRSSIKDEMVISIDNEIRYCRSFLELYNLRFEELFEVVVDVEEEILTYGIPKHLLQPIVENSIVHGIDMSRDNNVITINGRRAGNLIQISVYDNGNGIEPARLGLINNQLQNLHMFGQENIGLVNVESRIKLIYGNECGIHIQSGNGGTKITLTLSAMTKEELRRNVQSIDR
ncbi:sensor histidine kinase [Cohnella herbarum]|uniref:Histidine kinase n=1 Tax=Cohnella herbarum TaxID=2728023 RepID=A0A7Z2ZNC7_9BACL|nr:histidine kinase [Cohnella herbarum]QJD86271.1 histidine kinase [Cohnella herbarum]